MVHAIKMGWMKPRPAKKTEVEDESKRKFYMLWQTDDQVKRKDVRIFDPLLAGGGGNEKSPRPDSSPKDVPSWPRGELQPSSRVRNTRKRPTLIHCLSGIFSLRRRRRSGSAPLLRVTSASFPSYLRSLPAFARFELHLLSFVNSS